MKTVEWYPLADSLKDFLRNYRYSDGRKLFEYLPNYDSLNIVIGAGNAGEYPLIEIKFGEENSLDKPSNVSCGVIQFWIDVYIGGENLVGVVDELGQALYRQLYLMEKELVFALQEFRKTLYKMYGTETKVDIVAILSDGDENSPVTIEHRIVCNLTYYRDK